MTDDILKNTYDKKNKGDWLTESALGSIIQNNSNKGKKKRVSKKNLKSFLNYHSLIDKDFTNISKEDSGAYSIPTQETEKPDEGKHTTDKIKHKPKIDVLDIDDKLTKILKLFLQPSKDVKNTSNTNNSTINNSLEKYYTSSSPNILNKFNKNITIDGNKINTQTYTARSAYHFDNKIISLDNTINKNINDISEMTVNENENTENKHHSATDKKTKNTNKVYFNISPPDEHKNTTINRKINMVKVLNKSTNSYETLPALESGGIATEPTKVIVGEKGPEAILPLSGAMGDVANGIMSTIGKSPLGLVTSTIQKMYENVVLTNVEKNNTTNTSSQQVESGGGMVSMPPPEQESQPSGVSNSGNGVDPLTISLLKNVSIPPWRNTLG